MRLRAAHPCIPVIDREVIHNSRRCPGDPVITARAHDGSPKRTDVVVSEARCGHDEPALFCPRNCRPAEVSEEIIRKACNNTVIRFEPLLRFDAFNRFHVLHPTLRAPAPDAAASRHRNCSISCKRLEQREKKQPRGPHRRKMDPFVRAVGMFDGGTKGYHLHSVVYRTDHRTLEPRVYRFNLRFF